MTAPAVVRTTTDETQDCQLFGKRQSEVARNLYRWGRAFGVDPFITLEALRHLPRYLVEARRFSQALPGHRVQLRPHLVDARAQAGVTGGHYFWQDLLVARRIFETNPKLHLDVGSRLDGLVAHLLAFRSVDVVDIRDLESQVSGLRFVRDDATRLDSIPDESSESVSSLHAIEHFGLGRYGDPIDPDGHMKGLRTLRRVLAPGGRLWVSYPIGKPSVEFNGQRIIHPELAVDELSDLELRRFTAIPPSGAPTSEFAPIDLLSRHGWCGLYEFKK